MEQKDPADSLRTKANRARIAAVVACYLLAFCWSIDAFFVWLFLGAAVYFEFLHRFYIRQVQPQEIRWEQSSRSGPISMKGMIPILIALAVFGLVASIIVSAVHSDNPAPSENEMPGDTPPDRSATGNQEFDDLSMEQKLDILTRKGNDLYNQGDYDSALILYEEVLKLEPNNQYGLYDKALAYYAKKDYNRPIPLLRRCLRDHPEYGEAGWLLGSVYLARSNSDSATFYLDQAYQNGLRDGSFLQMLADQYRTRDHQRAIDLYRQSLERDSSLLESYQQLIQLDPEKASEYQRMMKRVSQ